MRRLFAQFVVLSVGALALIGMDGVSTLLASSQRNVPVANDSTELAVARAQLADARHELDRAHQILEYSVRYAIPADLTTQIYDVATSEGIPPALGFQLVKVESGFQNTAQSTAAAIGLTQLRLPTARAYDATVNPSDLMNAEVNLRLGFRYLKDLLARFGHSVPLALEAYNKGPTFVAAEHDLGNTVQGRYSKAVMSGLRKKG